MQKKISQILPGQLTPPPPTNPTPHPLPRILEQESVDLRLHSGPPLISISGSIEKGRRVQFSAIPGYCTLLYISEGAVTINCETIAQYNLIVFEKENDELIVTAESDTRLLFLSAGPDPAMANLSREYPVLFTDPFCLHLPPK
jgi:hypothetical protein